MGEFTQEEKTILVQHVVKKFEDENTIIEKLGKILDSGEADSIIDMLIGTQKVRRIGPDILQNNESHTEMPPLPERLLHVLDRL